MPRLSKIGAAALAAFGWTSGGVQNVTASYLVVAGGGSGGYGNGGGGGAGGLQTGTTSLSLSTSYTVTVGAGGPSTTVSGNGNPGSNSVFGSLTASVGGGYAGGGQSPYTGGNGGSGGGSGSFGSGTVSGGTGTSGQGNNGGSNGGFAAPGYPTGGGGGAGAAGSNASGTTTAGNGGNGLSSSISGSSVTYAGGGGGGVSTGTAGTGGTGGGGAGSSGGSGSPGSANTGGGGGGSASATSGAGGSGIVIIAYPLPQKFGGGVITTDGTNCIHTFTTSGTLSPINSLSASYLIVAGGGAGNSASGGGGAGGMLTGSALTIDTNSTYLVTVGAGGTSGGAGTNSNFGLVSTTAIGGGGGGQNGGSGGGAGSTSGGTYAGGLGTAGQGNNGGANNPAAPYPAGGGGGAGAVGGTGSGNNSGNGGNGLSSSISGTATYYAGGGGAGIYQSPGVAGSGGLGGGGAGSSAVSGNGTSGTANTGGGGGGAGSYAGGGTGGAGGSGIVIISYAGTTQQMAGGTVTIVGGNVIHTFTSSGYLTPLTFVGNSLRFRSSASAYLNRTPTVASNRTTWTWSGWVKKGTTSGYQNLFSAGTAAGSNSGVSFHTDSNSYSIDFYAYNGGYTARLLSSQLMRDYAAWYHIVAVYDSTQATASNRMKLYLNGVQMTAFSTATYPSQNTTTDINNATGHYIGNIQNTNYFDGYMANVQFIDGQALAPTAFGTFNSYGVWQPINYGGSYGTNGFYLPFSNKTSTTTLGYDFSPAGNNWTTNNISLTAGATYDSMTDVPTLTSATTANYAVLNPLIPNSATFSNGNLTYTTSGASHNWSSTIALPTSGKWYFEMVFTSGPYLGGPGIAQTPDGAAFPASSYFLNENGAVYVNGSIATNLGSTWAIGDVIGCVADMDNNKLYWYKNGTVINSGGYSVTAPTASNPYFLFGNAYTSSSSMNFGQQGFTYTPPLSSKALNTYNM